jgi:branched-chain amino acid transport system ATP-binding protein
VTTLLQSQGLAAGYGGSAVIRDIDLTVASGSMTGIIGPNGAGKSTFLKAVMGFLVPSAGRVRLAGDDIAGKRTDERIRLGIGYVAQARSHFPNLSVLENLRVGAFLLRDKRVVERRLQAVFDRFPILHERRKVPAGLLSGGELRMLEIGRFLMLEPRLVLLDEPSIGLAPPLVEAVYERLLWLKDEGITFLIVEQNVRKILEVADYVYVFETGRNRFEGPARRFAEQGELAGLYLGGASASEGLG